MAEEAVPALDTRFQAQSEAMLAWVEKELQASEPRVLALRQMREGLRGLLGLDPSEPRPHVVADRLSLRRPRLAILDLMAEEPRTWTLKELVVAMRERGWLDPRLDKGGEDAVRHAADYLAKSTDRVVKVASDAWEPEAEDVTDQRALPEGEDG